MEIQLGVKNHFFLLFWITGFILFYISVLSYIQTEILTSSYLSQIQNSQDLCKTDQNADLKFIKLVSFEKSKKNGRIFCIYGDSSKNIQVDVYYNRDNWYPSFTKKLNRERNFYWPIYY